MKGLQTKQEQEPRDYVLWPIGQSLLFGCKHEIKEQSKSFRLAASYFLLHKKK
jgi:hypothetical protein